MPTDPKQLESFLNKLATDDEFRHNASQNPEVAYAAHGLKYAEPEDEDADPIPPKEKVQKVVDKLNEPGDEQDPKIFSDKIFADIIFADQIFHDQIFHDKIFADKIFADQIYKHDGS